MTRSEQSGGKVAGRDSDHVGPCRPLSGLTFAFNSE